MTKTPFTHCAHVRDYYINKADQFSFTCGGFV